jgi:hypothetical protein
MGLIIIQNMYIFGDGQLGKGLGIYMISISKIGICLNLKEAKRYQ